MTRTSTINSTTGRATWPCRQHPEGTPTMPADWLTAHVVLTVEGVEQARLLDALQDLTTALAPAHAAIALALRTTPASGGNAATAATAQDDSNQLDRIEIDLDAQHGDPHDPTTWAAATDHVQHQIRTAITTALPTATTHLTTLTLTPDSTRTAALAAADRDRDLVGVSEVADMLGVVRQSAQRTVELADFPTPYATTTAGRFWRRYDVAQYIVRTRARAAARSQQPQVIPPLEQRQQLRTWAAELALPVAAIPAPDLLGSHLLEVIIGLGGNTTTVAQRLGVTPRTVQRWIATARTHDTNTPTAHASA